MRKKKRIENLKEQLRIEEERREQGSRAKTGSAKPGGHSCHVNPYEVTRCRRISLTNPLTKWETKSREELPVQGCRARTWGIGPRGRRRAIEERAGRTGQAESRTGSAVSVNCNVRKKERGDHQGWAGVVRKEEEERQAKIKREREAFKREKRALKRRYARKRKRRRQKKEFAAEKKTPAGWSQRTRTPGESWGRTSGRWNHLDVLINSRIALNEVSHPIVSAPRGKRLAKRNWMDGLVNCAGGSSSNQKILITAEYKAISQREVLRKKVQSIA